MAIKQIDILEFDLKQVELFFKYLVSTNHNQCTYNNLLAIGRDIKELSDPKDYVLPFDIFLGINKPNGAIPGRLSARLVHKSFCKYLEKNFKVTFVKRLSRIMSEKIVLEEDKEEYFYGFTIQVKKIPEEKDEEEITENDE